ncbi:MAG: NlpC/P60 family protein [Clostridiales bacterium]|jgi:hypothetical protein|nr:C40 family peptidase [Eubacteriales bacterium]MDH7566552.1 NlpC/P60 family protein [Clostridiales bacterium]
MKTHLAKRRAGKKRKYGEKLRKLLPAIGAILLLALFLKCFNGIDTVQKKREARSRSYIINEYFLKEQADSQPVQRDILLRDLMLTQLGKPYGYEKEGPDSFDCSGLVRYIYSKLGISLPRTAYEQSESSLVVQKSELRFGDLVFFSADGINITHAGIYIGGGYFMHAPKTDDVVKISRMDSGYYSKTYKKAVRVIDPP